MGGQVRAHVGPHDTHDARDDRSPMGNVSRAIPEAFLTAWGSLVTSLNVRKGNALLIRGGTSSVGMAAVIIAKELGATVVAATRSAAKKQALIAKGADHVVIDNGSILV